MRRKLMIALVAAAIMIVGCSKEEEKPKPAPTAPPVPKSTAGAPASPGAMAGNAPSSPMAAGGGATMPPAASGAAADASAAAQTQAKQLIDQAMQYIKENKLDLAEKSLNQLDAMKGQLPAEWAPRIEQVRSALSAAKATSGSGVLPSPGSK
jgi:hypothetical protein